jgi:hypothetical protein
MMKLYSSNMLTDDPDYLPFDQMELIGEFEDEQACVKEIVARVGKQPYMRFLLLGHAKVVDYGSWGHFFYIVE